MAKVFVGNLSYDTTSKALEEAFRPFNATSAHIALDRETRRSRGYGFVAFENEESAQEAVREMNGAGLDGRYLRCALAARPPAVEGPPADEAAGEAPRRAPSAPPVLVPDAPRAAVVGSRGPAPAGPRGALTAGKGKAAAEPATEASGTPLSEQFEAQLALHKANPLCRPTWKDRTSKTNEEHLAHLRGSGQSSRRLFLGDSMVERFQRKGYNKEFSDGLREREVMLAGVGGDGCQHMLWRIQQGLLDACPRDIDTVLLMAGTNNIVQSPPAQVAEAVGLIVDLLRIAFPAARIVVFGLTPRNSGQRDMDDTAMDRRVDEFNAAISQIPGIDYRYFGDELKSADGHKNHRFYEDHVHLKRAGYALFWEAVRSALDDHP